MDHTRIYKDKVEIDEKSVAEFYNRRAEGSRKEQGTTEDGAVLLGSQDAGVLAAKAQYESDYIMPMLGIDSKTRVLDLGCGLGRWAQYVMPHCGFYCGVDASEKMIELARNNCSRLGTHFRLQAMTISDAVGQTSAFWGGPFDLVITSGVMMYLNDDTLTSFFQQLPQHLAEHCTLHFADPVGTKERLTLNRHVSEALSSTYSAIYRTVDEYLDFLAPLRELGFSVVKSEQEPRFGETYTDTHRHYFILRR